MTRITAEMLRSKDACSSHVDIFAQTFPRGTGVTLASCKKAVAAGLDLGWFARHFLTAPAWAAYKQATAPAWAAYKQATAPALAAAWEMQEGKLI